MQKENHGSYVVNICPLGVFWGTFDQDFAPEYLVRFYIFLMYTCLPLLQRNSRHGSHGGEFKAWWGITICPFSHECPKVM